MTTTREPTEPPRRPEITRRAVELFVAAEAITHDRDACNKAACAVCARYAGLVRELCIELALRPWELDPLITTHRDPPEWMDAQERAGWRQAYALRRALLAAAREAAKA